MTASPSRYQLVVDPAPILRAGSLPPRLSPAESPLSALDLRELAAARDRAKVIRKAARVAAFNGWTTAACAALSAASALFDPTGLVITAALAFVAYNEFRGRKRLLSFDPSAASLLGWNQLGLLAMIVVYCLWSLYSSLGQGGVISAELKSYAELDSVLGQSGGFQSLYKTFSYGLYGGVIVLSALFQGGNAVYYFTRRRHIEDFLAETPPWVREVQGGTV
jgi:hypothetical protein